MVANADLGNCKEKWVCYSIYIKCNGILCKEGINHYKYFLMFDGIKKVPQGGTFRGKNQFYELNKVVKF